MKKQLKEARMLHLRADQLLELCEEAQKKVDSMCRWNVEQAIPNGFETHSDEDIEFQQRVVERIFRSYKVLVNKINENTEL
jgi:hypothetical protein